MLLLAYIRLEDLHSHLRKTVAGYGKLHSPMMPIATRKREVSGRVLVHLGTCMEILGRHEQ